MRAIRVSENGEPRVMKLVEVPTPEPGPGQARIKIHAAGVNFIDVYQRRGRYKVPTPFTPGLEAAGVVEAVGPGVRDVKVGDRVAYTDQLGSYAEENVVKADRLIPLPAGVSFEKGAAFPLQGMTAHYLLHEFHEVRPGETILVHAAAGGMGLLLVQWAKKLGATVIGTVSTKEKAEAARRAGADHVINYAESDFVAETKRLTGDRGADYIIDGVGKSTFKGDLEAVRARGHITLFGAASGVADPFPPNDLQARAITVSGGTLFAFVPTREELLQRAGAVLSGVQEGWLDLNIGEKLPLADAVRAHELLESRKTSGKVLLLP